MIFSIFDFQISNFELHYGESSFHFQKSDIFASILDETDVQKILFDIHLKVFSPFDNLDKDFECYFDKI